MRTGIPDWKLASISAAGLTGVAAFVIFVVRPGGFEGGIGWFIALLPGAVLGLPLSERVYRTAPAMEPFALWTATLTLSLLWYFAVAFILIKVYRLIAWVTGQ